MRNDLASIDYEITQAPVRVRRKPIDILVGNRLARLRCLNGITVGILSRAVDIPSHVIKSYESGRVRAPAHVLTELARFFDVPLNDLFAGTCQNRREQENSAVVKLQSIN